MSKYKAILMELLGTALNFSDGELSELIPNTDDLSDEQQRVISEKAKERYRTTITGINKTAQVEADKKFQAGQRTKAQEFEKLLKEQFNVQSDKTGSELIDDIKESLSKQSSQKNSKDLTDDDIKKHPAFIRAENEYKAQLKALNEDKERSINELQASYQKKETFSKVSKEALAKFDELRPVLSDDPKKAAAQRELLLEKLSSYEFQEVDGKFIPLKEGKRVENEFGHAIAFEDVVKNTASQYFDFKVAEDRKAPNGDQQQNQQQQQQGSNYKGTLPKTEAEYIQLMNNRNLPISDRKAINDYWEKQAQN